MRWSEIVSEGKARIMEQQKGKNTRDGRRVAFAAIAASSYCHCF